MANIADLMGHKDLATTQIYAKVALDHLREAVSLLAPLVPAAVSPDCVTQTLTGWGTSRKLLTGKDLPEEEVNWLGGRGSKPDAAGQSRMSYR